MLLDVFKGIVISIGIAFVATILYTYVFSNKCPECDSRYSESINYCTDCGYELQYICSCGEEYKYNEVPNYCKGCGDEF